MATKCETEGKTRYRTQDAANSALRHCQKQGNRERVPVRSYKCLDCKGFHLTSKPMYGRQTPIKNEQLFEKFLKKEEEG